MQGAFYLRPFFTTVTGTTNRYLFQPIKLLPPFPF